MDKRLFEEIIGGCGIRDFGFTPFDPRLVRQNVRSISRIPQNCKSVIVCLFPYFVNDEPRNVSLYAVSRDYHIILKKYLTKICESLKNEFPDNEFSYFTDSSPIKEVAAAALCGLGVIGRNGMLLTKDYGSYVFLGEVLTDLSIDCEPHGFEFCENCGRCVAACPSGALGEKVDVGLCISDVTQRKGKLSESELALYYKGKYIWGCDVCQQVCPHNQSVKATYFTEFYEHRIPFVTEKNYLDDFENRAYSWRGKAVIERNLKLEKNRE